MLPHEFGALVAGFFMPLATLWFFVAYFRRGQDVRHHTELLRRQLALLTYPAEEAEARIRTISDSLRRQADELSRSSDHATVQLQELVAADRKSTRLNSSH